MGEIRLGTSGYSFEHWKGTVYPSGIKNSEMFAYYIDQFRLNSVEINYTYYKMPSSNVFTSHVQRSPKDFQFTVKLFSGITHEPWMGSADGQLDHELCFEFLDGIRPLIESGKLGCLLAQFPPHMKPSDQAWAYLEGLYEAFSRYPLVYEFRNKRWISDDTFKALRQRGIGFCAVDEPHIDPLMPLVPEVTSSIAYLRLHGRSEKWFSDSALRYDYLYSEDELKSFLPTIHQMQSKSETLYIQFNNCHAGSAVRNVKMMQYLLDLDVPPLQGVLF